MFYFVEEFRSHIQYLGVFDTVGLNVITSARFLPVFTNVSTQLLYPEFNISEWCLSPMFACFSTTENIFLLFTKQLQHKVVSHDLLWQMEFARWLKLSCFSAH